MLAIGEWHHVWWYEVVRAEAHHDACQAESRSMDKEYQRHLAGVECENTTKDEAAAS